MIRGAAASGVLMAGFDSARDLTILPVAD